MKYSAFEWSHRQVWENSVEKVLAVRRLVDMTKFFEKVALVLVYSSQMNFEVHACMAAVNLKACAFEFVVESL